MKRAYLLTGEPGSGKTTVIKEVLSEVSKRAGGFYTEEIRNRGIRRGFRIVTLDGEKAVLAHSDILSPYRVSKYGVDIDSIDSVAVPSIMEAIRARDIVVIDEIGKMELLSSHFKDAVIKALESEKMVIGTIMLASHPWTDSVKRLIELEIIPVGRFNHGKVVSKLVDWLGY